MNPGLGCGSAPGHTSAADHDGTELKLLDSSEPADQRATGRKVSECVAAELG